MKGRNDKENNAMTLFPTMKPIDQLYIVATI